MCIKLLVLLKQFCPFSLSINGIMDYVRPHLVNMETVYRKLNAWQKAVYQGVPVPKDTGYVVFVCLLF